jgi:hypothetical protein
VGIAMAAVQPPHRSIVVKLKGQTLLIPEWTADEWRWYCALALRIADTTPAVGTSALVLAKARAAQRVTANVEKLPAGAAAVAAPDAVDVYRDAVMLVIATGAAATGSVPFGDAASAAMKELLAEAPSKVLTPLRDLFNQSVATMQKFQREAARLVASAFGGSVRAVAGGLLEGLGPAGLIAVGLVVLYLVKK